MAVLVGFFFVVLLATGNSDPQPEQIHLSATGDVTEMLVTWVTLSLTNGSMVEYGKVGGELNMKAYGTVSKFVDGGSEHRVLYMHRAKMVGLVPSQVYEYHVGGMDGWSPIFSFQAIQSGTDWIAKIALFGDLGSGNAKSLSYLQEETQNRHFDAIIHVGDFAYDMNTNNALVGDDFMNQIVPMAAYVPYMTCPGNHENAYNFSNYKARFSMPGNTESMYYSWNHGPVHFISISTEFYFFLNYGFEQIVQQYKWLEKDLAEANSPENRAKRPWIITFGHRPMYCTNTDGDDCTKGESIVRTGVSSDHLYPLEPLFYKYGVDMEIWAHEHSYERLFPVFDRMVFNGSVEEPYTNPGAPVHVITGTAGCREGHNPFTKNSAPWSAFRSVDYGYTRMTVYNSSHLFMDQVSIDQGGKVIDEMWLIKDVHGPEAWKQKKAN